jgi:predicted nuclease of predicted toxin-antitoxin system
MQSVLGYPPKIIFLGLGNCTNQQVTEALIGTKTEIEAALSKEDTGFVEII